MLVTDCLQHSHHWVGQGASEASSLTYLNEEFHMRGSGLEGIWFKGSEFMVDGFVKSPKRANFQILHLINSIGYDTKIQNFDFLRDCQGYVTAISLNLTVLI